MTVSGSVALRTKNHELAVRLEVYCVRNVCGNHAYTTHALELGAHRTLLAVVTPGGRDQSALLPLSGRSDGRVSVSCTQSKNVKNWPAAR
jgi:hypothetical protein